MWEICEICLKLIKLMIFLLTHSVKPHAKPPPNSLFLMGVQSFVKIKNGRGSQSWYRMGVNSLFKFGGNLFKASCMYSYSVLFLINSSRLSDCHKTSVPSPIRGILWLQLLGWGTKGEVHVSLEEYDTPLHTDFPVFVVNFEQVSYLVLLHVFLKVFLKC